MRSNMDQYYYSGVRKDDSNDIFKQPFILDMIN